MHRWVFAFVLFVVPFQLVWGSAAPYCAHEASNSVKKHFGHHDHKHQASGDTSSAKEVAPDITGGLHADCESCHLGSPAFMPAVSPTAEVLPHGDAVGDPEPRYDSHIPGSPLRPDRGHPTPAARFGGGVVMVSLAD